MIIDICLVVFAFVALLYARAQQKQNKNSAAIAEEGKRLVLKSKEERRKLEDAVMHMFAHLQFRARINNRRLVGSSGCFRSVFYYEDDIKERDVSGQEMLKLLDGIFTSSPPFKIGDKWWVLIVNKHLSDRFGPIQSVELKLN